jgi:hypothetical protein
LNQLKNLERQVVRSRNFSAGSFYALMGPLKAVCFFGARRFLGLKPYETYFFKKKAEI